ncbi:MAG: hypothetical protein WCG83_03770 [Candidatus Peregrinibacteria bacterium]
MVITSQTDGDDNQQPKKKDDQQSDLPIEDTFNLGEDIGTMVGEGKDKEESNV